MVFPRDRGAGLEDTSILFFDTRANDASGACFWGLSNWRDIEVVVATSGATCGSLCGRRMDDTLCNADDYILNAGEMIKVQP